MFTQEGSLEQTAKSWKYFEKKYKNESHRTMIHIPLHAIHWHIFLKFFGQRNLDREIKKTNEYPDYKKAWDIVRTEGHRNIIREFKGKIV